MAVYAADRAELLVFTRRAGLLSAVGHDLELRAGELELTVDPDRGEGAGGGKVSLRCNAASLKVVAAQRDGRADVNALSASDRAQIEKNLADDVLQVRRFPGISFEATGADLLAPGRRRLRGNLLLHGVTRSLEAVVEEEEGSWRTEVVLHQPDYGIKPFSAMLGSLRVEADVRVRLTVRR